MEENLLFTRTFLILGGMLLLTTITSRLNKAYETNIEFFVTITGTFLSLFVIYVLGDQFPANIIAVGVFSLFIGWSLGPTIASIGEKFKFRKFLKDKMVLSKTITTKKTTFTDRLIGKEDEKKTVYFFKSDPEKTFDRMSNEFRELKLDFEKNILPHDRYNQEWQNIVFQALIGTTLAVLLTATIVVFTDNDFGFLGPILLICLIALVIMEFLNVFFFKSRRRRLIQAYFGVVLFTLYLIYDFNRLEKAIARGDDSWSTAIDIAVNIYLDLINLFIDLLEILASSE